MSKQLTADDFRDSLNHHVAIKGDEIYGKFGPTIGWRELLALLEDRSVVRYPCKIVFDAQPLLPGEFAQAIPKSDAPEDGFIIYVHPLFSLELDRVPYLVLYHLVAVNYGTFASAEDAEAFGAHALGINPDDYYQILCTCADTISFNGET